MEGKLSFTFTYINTDFINKLLEEFRMELEQHSRNVKALFDFWDASAPKLGEKLRHALAQRFNQRIEKYGFLDLHDLEDLRTDPNAVAERAYRNFNEGNFLDAINLAILRHYVVNTK